MASACTRASRSGASRRRAPARSAESTFCSRVRRAWAVDPEAARALEAVFADIVVDRGQEARAPRDLLALRLPGQAAPVVPQDPEARAQATDLDLVRRGPEITEIR